MLEIFSKSLKHRLALPLPGREAQLKMAHAERRLNLSRYKIPAEARPGSVLILLFEDEGTIKLPLIMRSDYDGVHSGQIGLPGGNLNRKMQTYNPLLSVKLKRKLEFQNQMFPSSED